MRVKEGFDRVDAPIRGVQLPVGRSSAKSTAWDASSSRRRRVARRAARGGPQPCPMSGLAAARGCYDARGP